MNLSSLRNILTEAALTKKHCNWAYEEEIRFLSSKNPGLRKFKAEALEAVILGMNISSQDEQLIIELLKQEKWSHVTLKKAKSSISVLGIDIL